MLFWTVRPRTAWLWRPGYPSPFSLEVLELAAAAGLTDATIGPYFIVCKADRGVVGEIGCDVDTVSGTAQVGYSVVEPLCGRGYATEALHALIAHLLGRVGVRRVVAETLVEHTASRRVMEKAGMRHCGDRIGEEDGRPAELVVYEALPQRAARHWHGHLLTRRRAVGRDRPYLTLLPALRWAR